MSEFSVLMPVYYKEDPVRFRSALDSVFNNQMPPDEVIVVCDGDLNDDLEAVLVHFSSYDTLRIVRLPHNRGIVKALNVGMQSVSNELVIRCDSDDVNKPNRFEILVAKICEGFDVVGSQTEEVDGNGHAIGSKNLPLDHDAIISFARSRNPINHMTVAFRKSLFHHVGGYPDVYLKEDYALWAKLFHAGAKFANIDEALVVAHAGTAMYARRGGMKAALAELKLQSILVNCGISSFHIAFFYGALRFLILSAPVFVRVFVYRVFLRDKN